MDEEFFSTQTYTPGSDLAVGFKPNQIIWGRSGNDTFLGLQPLTPEPGQSQIDIFIGDVALDDPALRQWSDTFILGDWTEAYYDNGNPDIFGVNDFGLVADFNPNLDFIQLYGSANDYLLLDVGVGSALVQQQDSAFNVVGFLLGNSNLSLASNYFDFRGTTPPSGPVFGQIQQLGSPEFDITPTTTADSLGNVYIAGGTTGSLGGTNNGESRDAVVAKYDNQGNQLWTKQLGTSVFDTIYGIDTDPQGNFYVVGITEGDLAGAKQGEASDAWVAKYDSEGNQLWIEQFGQNIIFQSFSIDVDGNGDVYLSGIDVKSAPEVVTDDFWISKFDTDGNQEWFTEFGTDNTFDESYDVTVSNDGSVYVTGWTLGDLAAENAGVYDAWLGRLDNDGEIDWLRQLGSSDYDWGWGVDTDSQGNVYATGFTLGSLGGENAGSYDAWLAKYDRQGNQQWIQQFGSAGDDTSFEINIDANDNIFLTGYTNGSLGGENAGSYDAWVAKYDTEGNQAWLQQYGTPEFDQGYGITSDPTGNLFITGTTQGSLGATNAGSFDSWLAKLNADSGSLENFGGTPDPLDALPTLNTVAANSADSQLPDAEMIDFLSIFFQDFVTNTLQLSPGSGGPNGSGLETLVSNPYPQPAPVPEPSSGVGLLLFATFSCAYGMFKARLKRPIRLSEGSISD